MLVDKILLPDPTAEPIATAIWSTLPADQRSDGYDRMAEAYDRVMGNGFYNRLVWGASVRNYAGAAHEGLAGAGDEPILDCRCGLLVFTAQACHCAPLVLRGIARG